jgi:hypothetical protein
MATGWMVLALRNASFAAFTAIIVATVSFARCAIATVTWHATVAAAMPRPARCPLGEVFNFVAHFSMRGWASLGRREAWGSPPGARDGSAVTARWAQSPARGVCGEHLTFCGHYASVLTPHALCAKSLHCTFSPLELFWVLCFLLSYLCVLLVVRWSCTLTPPFHSNLPGPRFRMRSLARAIFLHKGLPWVLLVCPWPPLHTLL